MEKNALIATIRKIETNPAITNLVKAVETDGKLRAQIQAAGTAEEKAAAAVKNGYSVTAQDMEALSDAADLFSEGELSDAELDTVAGGISIKGLIVAAYAVYKVYKVVKKALS